MSLVWKSMKIGKSQYPERLQSERKRMVNDASPFAISEAYKAARTNLMFMGDCNRIAFTSSLPNEGKTINCINLAITIAQTGNKVLLIDADLRKPSLHRMFYEQVSPGLSDRLAGLSGETCIRETNYENLFLITAGRIPPNPAELLGSNKMLELLKEVEKDYDFIFLDTPPINLVTDAVILTKVVQGVVFIVREGVTRMDVLKEAINKLEQVNANVLGFLLNEVDAKKKSYRYRYKYNYKYSYSYGPEHDHPLE